MIITETLENGLVLNRSDSGMKICQNETGAVYDEAVDVTPCRYTYTETDIPITTDLDFIPVWDVRSGESFKVGDRVVVDGVVYECIKAHTAAWSRQPPNSTYWEEVIA